MDGSPGRKRQTTERDHFLRTVRSSNFYNDDDDNNNNSNGSSNNNNGNVGNSAADRKAARDHYFRWINCLSFYQLSYLCLQLLPGSTVAN